MEQFQFFISRCYLFHYKVICIWLVHAHLAYWWSLDGYIELGAVLEVNRCGDGYELEIVKEQQ